LKNFIIVGTQRTGSSALGEAIAFHSKVVCGWEWTERVSRKNKIPFAQRALMGDFSHLADMHKKHMADNFNSNLQWLGYRRLFGSSDKWIFHPKYSIKSWLDQLNDHIKWFRSCPDLHIIHIVRHNNIEWLKSKYVARKAGSFVGKAYPKDIKVKIPISAAVRRLQAKKWIDDQLALLERSNPYLQLSYESLSEGMDGMLASMLEFLKCAPEVSIKSGGMIKKQSNKRPQEYIENYEELVTQLELLDLLKY